MKAHGWIGLAVVAAAEVLLFAGNPTVAGWFTPLMPVRKVVTRSVRGMFFGAVFGSALVLQFVVMAITRTARP